MGVLFAALVLMPVIEGTHDHGDLDRGTACVACVLAHHTAEASISLGGIDGPRATHVEVPATASVAPAFSPAPASPGRAPPTTASSVRV